MSLERARRSIAQLRSFLGGGEVPVVRTSLGEIDPRTALELFESQLVCRLVDVESHELRARGAGYYTICSAGHEGNVVLGRLTRPGDPALLHYRSGAFFLERARQVPEVDAVLDLCLSLAASADDPISGGRHKVFGSVPLGIPPQTSTIASHLPKAVGMAVAMERAARLGRPAAPADAVVICSFGDASLNHSTAQGALNAASWVAFQKLPVPILFVCEDNGLGISVRTPPGWIEARLRGQPSVTYFACDGTDLAATWETTSRALEHVRRRRAPAVLHLGCERLWGHAGSDVDADYRALDEIAASEARDPLLRTAAALIDAGVAVAGELAARLDDADARVHAASAEAVKRPKLKTRADVMEPIAPSRPALVSAEARREVPDAPRHAKPLPLGHAIRAALDELLRKYPEMMVFGEDVAQKGGVYGVTSGLWKTFGPKRVFNTLLDEQTILGLALGAGQVGLLPVPEIQFLAYLHNAEDQLRGEASTLSFFSRGQLKNPMLLRIAGLGYQKGFGGHFHNDDSLAVLRDLPGVIVAVPSRGDDAVKMLRTLAAHARVDGRVCVIVEPIALYATKDLHPGDGAWTFPVPPAGEAIEVGEVGVYGPDATALCVITYGNGVPMCLRVRDELARDGHTIRVIDLRWIAPLPEDAIRTHARACGGRVLCVDECRRSGNVAEAVATALLEDPSGPPVSFARVTAADSFIPLADAARLVLPDEPEIETAARRLLAEPARAAKPAARARASRPPAGDA
jgi:2-oxoisovalerate dehydrogenase E1 component